jgi:septal ring-binding cell division protein DamX
LHEVHNRFKINNMDEKTKLYVFSKREVALIFLFMFLIALTSFVFGVKIGKSYSYEQAGIEPQDRQRVELLSGQEESVNQIVEETQKGVEMKPEMKAPDMEDLNKKLEQHIKEETSEEGRPKPVQVDEGKERVQETSNQMVEPAPGVEVSMEEGSSSSVSKDDQYSGKYTIQLGSHRALEEAQAFAEGFRVRGYNPIVNEVEIPGRGVWYRVSLGAFNSITEAKDYVKKENSLFQGQEYVFVRFE